MPAPNHRSIWTRKLDLLYLVFFIIHIPVLFCIDFVPLYPISLRPKFVTDLRTFYIDTYRDRFFTHPTPSFKAFTLLEAVYHLPTTLWMIPALVRDDPLVPLHLIIFGMETALTTLVCTVEMLGWDGYTREELKQLAQLYLPYLALALVMVLDAFFRLRGILLTADVASMGKKLR